MKVKATQRMALYQTKSKFYLVGSNNTQTSFRYKVFSSMAYKLINIRWARTGSELY